MSQIRKVLTHIWKHPLNKNQKVQALFRFFWWQISQRLIKKPRIKRFTKSTVLSMSKGETGATGNLYCGLSDFEEMSFFLHFLNSNDCFVDVGANVGVYSILTGGELGCEVYCFEPIPKAFIQLKNNIELNNLGSVINAFNVGIGNKKGRINITNNLDTVNHVCTDADKGPSIKTDIWRLDHVLNSTEKNLVIKIDVEGYEMPVLEGLGKLLESEKLLAVIIELNGAGLRYGVDDFNIHSLMISSGLKPIKYFPFKREIMELEKPDEENTIYIRDISKTKERVNKGKLIRIPGRDAY